MIDFAKPPHNLTTMTENEFNSEMEKSYKSMKAGKGVSAKKAFAKVKKSLNDFILTKKTRHQGG